MNKSEFFQELYVHKNYENLKNISTVQGSLCSEELQAKIFFLSQDYKTAAKIYNKLGMDFHEGYCELYLGNLERTKQLWENLEDSSSIIMWGKALLGVLEVNIQIYPTFFQLRNYLEIDLSNFILNSQFDYVQKIINALPLLIQINGECYKYIGRVFFNHGNIVDGKIFLEKSKNICYGDPETHILLAKCYMELQLRNKAEKTISDCLEIAPEYYPALIFFDNY